MMRVVILIFAIQLMEKINDFSRTLLLAIFFCSGCKRRLVFLLLMCLTIVNYDKIPYQYIFILNGYQSSK